MVIVVMESISHQEIRKQVLEFVEKALSEDKVNELLVSCRNLLDKAQAGLEIDIKTAVDTGFRDVLHKYIRLNTDNDDYQWYEKIIELSIKAVRSGICLGGLPILLLTDLFDCKPLNKCEELFSLLENRVNIWKEDIFFNNVKNQMLRSCNDLLRRLSRSQHTVFGGRILEFLARFFPLFERSGLNLTSEFNQENVVAISAQEDLSDASSISDSPMEEGEMPTSEVVQVDYNLYRKFWQLQSFFKNPNLCYSKPNWKQFQSYSTDVLTAFSTFKLDPQSNKATEKVDIQGEQIHFTKYLTNQRLLELQLSDSSFRRYILVQFLILFQYLTTYVKSKQESQTLTEEQNAWLKQSNEKVLELIGKTPPNGQEMTQIIEHILKREEFWCNWKNDGCPGLKEINETISKEPTMVNGRKRVGDEIKHAESFGKVIIGNPELTKLWNLCSDNLEACLSKKRIFIPPVDEFFGDVKTSYDEYSAEDRQKMLADDSDFNWRSLRLLGSKSSYFFTPSNQSMVKPIVQYLDTVIEKVVKELNAADGNKGSQDLAIDDAEDISNDELLKQIDENSNLGSTDNHAQNEIKRTEEKASV